MAGRPALYTAGVAALVAVLLAAAARVDAFRERVYPSSDVESDTLYVRSEKAARAVTLAYSALAADVYWIRAIQYYGGTKRMLVTERAATAAGDSPVHLTAGHRQYGLLYPLLDLTTALDPRFNIAYRFGAIFLAEMPPGGPGRPDLAIALLLKGLRERPDKWEYMQDIGFVHYWWLHDFQAAARWFDRASQVPGAPWWLRSLAATTLVQGGDRQSSRLMWSSIRQSAEIDWLRHEAERKLAQLQALDQIDALQQVVDRYRAADGRLPDGWPRLVRARALPGTPVDPTGVPYDLVAGRVQLSTSSTLFPPPDAPSVTVHPPS
jgi:hypothetical protein